MIKYIDRVALETACVIYLWRKRPLLSLFCALIVVFMAAMLWLALRSASGEFIFQPQSRILAFIDANPFASLCFMVGVWFSWIFICMLWCQYKKLDWIALGKKRLEQNQGASN
ncbi:TPA: hypothetical protein RQN23_000831 [Aeromonas veronii]|nr:hypothetical protein [Aeromonas veronii]